MSVKTIVCGSFGKKDVEDTIGERVVAALRPQRLRTPWSRLVCRMLHIAPWLSCLPLHLSCASIPSQSFRWPIAHFFYHLLFIGLYNSQKKNKSWSGSFNRLQSHARGCTVRVAKALSRKGDALGFVLFTQIRLCIWGKIRKQSVGLCIVWV